MLRQCGQIIDGVQEFCDACWDCSSQCQECGRWFDKEQVGPLLLCIHCEREVEHEMKCKICSHEWTVKGFSPVCPKCGAYGIFVSKPDHVFYIELVEQAQVDHIQQLQAAPMQSIAIFQGLGLDA